MTRRNVVQFRITDLELEHLNAVRGKQSISDYVRARLFNAVPERQVMPSEPIRHDGTSKRVVTGAPRAVKETRECGLCGGRGLDGLQKCGKCEGTGRI